VGSLRGYVFLYPFTDRALAARFAQDLIKGGVQGAPPLPHEVWGKLLTGKEIKGLFHGVTMSIVDMYGIEGDLQIDGRGNAFLSSSFYNMASEQAKVWVEDDMWCQRYQNHRIESGMEWCSTIFRNPQGTLQGRDEYILVGDQGIWTGSIQR
jgi:hypothetical protein